MSSSEWVGGHRRSSSVKEYVETGFTEVYVSQIGEEQDAFFDFYAKEVLPRVR
ncbi:hypothetical protein ACQPYK_27070 [Streptosporangium sp. CA-135522]|uniref:hypothetical protein n=1 Tax=Streptosporangium sp. CA-135522 TaxID=3240072 RepID=UPI003D8A734F